MRPKIGDIVPKEVWELFGEIRLILYQLPDLIETPTFVLGNRMPSSFAKSEMNPNCHVVARSFEPFFPVEVHDGFVRAFNAEGQLCCLQHSWLTVKDADPRIIIDPWPLGVTSGPTIFIQGTAYHYGPKTTFLFTLDEPFRSEVESMTAVVRAAIYELWPDRVPSAA